MRTLRAFFKELFRFRDLAVHPSSEFIEPVHWADLDAAVEPRFLMYSAEHARKVLGLTIDAMTILITKAGLVARGDNEKWVEFAMGRIDVVRAARLAPSC